MSGSMRDVTSRAWVGKMSFLLLVWNCAALIARGAVLLAAADRMLAIREVMDPFCGLKVV